MSTPTPADHLRQLDGAQIPGGCDHCAAVQTITAPADHPNIVRVTVQHDDTCPWYLARAASQESDPR